MPTQRNGCVRFHRHSVRLEVVAITSLHFHAPRFFHGIAWIAERMYAVPVSAVKLLMV